MAGAGGGSKAFPYVFLVLAPLFWAGNFVFGQPLSEALPPFGINLIRWCLACAILVPLTLISEGLPRPGRRLWPRLFVMAITGVLMFNVLAYLSLGYTMRSTNAALINGTTPSLTMVTAVAIGLDRLASLRLIGALASLTGVVWILYRGPLEALFNLSFYRGDLIVLVATLMWAIYIILVDRITHTLSPLSLLRLLPPRSPCPF